MLDRHRRTGFPVTVVRPAAIYGPYNNIYDMETPMFLRLLRRLPILLPHDGLVTGSYGHVDDLVALMIATVGRPAALGEVFNVTAEAVTSRHYIDVLAAIVGVDADVRMVPSSTLDGIAGGVFCHLFSDRHHAVLSTDKARRLLGFQPTFGFESGHRDTYRWFCDQGLADLDHALADPVWHASWDFAAEAAAAAEQLPPGSVTR